MIAKPKPSFVRYVEGVGRRKTATARVRLRAGEHGAEVNGKSIVEYFRSPRLTATACAPLKEMQMADQFGMSARVQGGGIHAQADAIAHGVARALVEFDAELKKKLRAFGYLTRDPRMVERKKPGLRKARRAPQWQKR